MRKRQSHCQLFFRLKARDTTGIEGLDKILNPKRIAVIGADNEEGSVGFRLFNNLIGVGYSGFVYPVNPFSPSVQGITAYASVAKIPWPVDLAILAIPAHKVPQILEECGAASIRGIIIVSSGFCEKGPQGKALEDEVLNLKRAYNMRIIGPNSLGVMRPSIRLNAAFVDKVPKPGKVAFISQSGALCVSLLNWAAHANVGFSSFVSVGNMIDVNFADLIDYFGADPETSSIILYIEAIKDPRSFISAARRFAGTKPIIVIKAGKSTEGMLAASSHTGAMAGEDAIYDAAFRRVGIIRVEAIADLFSCSEFLAMQPTPKGLNLAMITNAGGPSVMATDFLISRGGKLAPLSNEALSELDKVLPPYWSRSNPLDVCEDASTQTLRRALEIRFTDQDADGFLIIYSPMGIADPAETARMIAELSKKTAKPILTSMLGEVDVAEAKEILRKNRIPAYSTPEQAISTFMYMYQYMRNQELLYETPEELPISPSSERGHLKEILERAAKEEREILTEPESKEFLEAYGIPTAKTCIAKTPEEAVKAASEIGFPVVMKILSPQITHKTDVGGVALNLASESQVQRCFKEMIERIEKRHPRIKVEGVTVQPMASCGYELIFGSKKDPQFGSVIIFGLGGTDVELFNDTSVGFPPMNQVLARRMTEQIKAYNALLKGFRGRPPINTRLLEETLVRFSQLIVDHPQIREADVNPIIIDEKSATAVDARIVIDTNKVFAAAHPYEHLIIRPYPAKYVTECSLRDGRKVLLRPIRPEDETLIDGLFHTFSEKTKRFRFFHAIKEMTHKTLARYCNIDYDREMAIVAELTEDGKRSLTGIVTLVVAFDGRSGEISIVVGDPWQNQGLGSVMFDCIIEIGKDMGLKRIIAEILAENKAMMNIARIRGFEAKLSDEETYMATLKLEENNK